MLVVRQNLVFLLLTIRQKAVSTGYIPSIVLSMITDWSCISIYYQCSFPLLFSRKFSLLLDQEFYNLYFLCYGVNQFQHDRLILHQIKAILIIHAKGQHYAFPHFYQHKKWKWRREKILLARKIQIMYSFPSTVLSSSPLYRSLFC